MLLPTTAYAKLDTPDGLRAYARARVAGELGDARQAANLYGTVLTAGPADSLLAARAMSQAIEAGDLPLAVVAAKRIEALGAVSTDARLLLLTEAIRTRSRAAAEKHLAALQTDQFFGFMAPILTAWVAHDGGDRNPTAHLDKATHPLAGAYVPEHRGLLLLASGKEEEGIAALAPLLADGGPRAARLRIAAAARLARRGKEEAALAQLTGDGPAIVAARRLIEADKPLPGEIATGADGAAELLIRLAIDFNRQELEQISLTFARLATFLAPRNSTTWLLAAELLGAADRPRYGLALLANVPADDPFAASAEDARIRLSLAAGETEAALARALAAQQASPATSAGWSRLGDLYSQLDRLNEAAASYGQAIALLPTAGAGAQPEWALHLLRGGALERANRWPEAKAALQAAHKLAPEQPIVLNYLGYAQLERRENIEVATALIVDALKRDPDSPEITDSLGWAYFLRGDLKQAIPLLERAAVGGPADPEINEHLGDAYYAAGRRIDARHAWRAALAYAEKEDADRLRAKLEAGLTPALASP